MSRRVDRALRTAEEVLDGLVCECGHVESEHRGASGEPNRECGVARCRCKQLRLVQFSVERAS
jgi:hypothetical protein